MYDGAAARDQTTAGDFLSGLGLPASLAQPDAGIFNPQKAKFCPYPTAAEYREAIAGQLATVPPPANLTSYLAELQATLGQGAAPSISSMNNTISDAGYWVGGDG